MTDGVLRLHTRVLVVAAYKSQGKRYKTWPAPDKLLLDSSSTLSRHIHPLSSGIIKKKKKKCMTFRDTRSGYTTLATFFFIN